MFWVGIGGLAFCLLVGLAFGLRGIIVCTLLYLALTAAFHLVVGKSWLSALLPLSRSQAAIATPVALVATFVAGTLGAQPPAAHQNSRVASVPAASVAAPTASVAASETPTPTPKPSPTPTPTPSPSATPTPSPAPAPSPTPTPTPEPTKPASSAPASSSAPPPSQAQTTQAAPRTQPVPEDNPGTDVKHYAKCADLNQDYPHGVARTGGYDKSSGKKTVTNFVVNDAVYNANSGLDRDGDGVACEAS